VCFGVDTKIVCACVQQCLYILAKIALTFVTAQINCAAAIVTDYRMKRNSLGCFLASAAMQMTSAHFRDFTRRRMAVSLPTVGDKIFDCRPQGSSMPREISA